VFECIVVATISERSPRGASDDPRRAASPEIAIDQSVTAVTSTRIGAS
jgi:hypothetical protein